MNSGVMVPWLKLRGAEGCGEAGSCGQGAGRAPKAANGALWQSLTAAAASGAPPAKLLLRQQAVAIDIQLMKAQAQRRNHGRRAPRVLRCQQRCRGYRGALRRGRRRVCRLPGAQRHGKLQYCRAGRQIFDQQAAAPRVQQLQARHHRGEPVGVGQQHFGAGGARRAGVQPLAELFRRQGASASRIQQSQVNSLHSTGARRWGVGRRAGGRPRLAS